MTTKTLRWRGCWQCNGYTFSQSQILTGTSTFCHFLSRRYHYLIPHLTALSNLVLITCIIKKSGRWQNLHIISFLSDYLPSKFQYEMFYLIMLSNLLIIICTIKKNWGWQNLRINLLFSGHLLSYYHLLFYLTILSKS